MAIITDKRMQAKSTGKDQWITEDGPRGHGRFQGRITKSGDRLFYFRYTGSDGTRTALPIGAYDPSGRAGLTLGEARARAGELSRLHQSGVVDVREHLDAEQRLLEADRAAAQARLDAEQERLRTEKAIVESRPTVKDLFERWASVDLIRHKDGGREIRRMFEKDVLPVIGTTPLEDVGKSHVTAVTDALLARGVPRMAKMIFSLVRQMFRFGVDRDLIKADPTATIRKAKIGGADVERDRVLSEDEIQQLALKIPASGITRSTEAAIWITLATCCRIGELLSAHWEDIDVNRRTWRIPPENSKNKKPHTISLSDFAMIHFNQLREISGTTPWCYPNRNGTQAVCTKTITKQLGDRQRLDKAPMSRRAKEDYASSLSLPGGKWTPHDLRRTGATMMVSLGVLPEVAERCLNHLEQNKVKRIYQRHSYEQEMRAGWESLGARLAHLSKG